MGNNKCVNITSITAPFNNVWTQKFKAQRTKSFFTTVNQMFGDSTQPPTTVMHCFVAGFRCLSHSQRFHYCELGNSRRLGEAAEQPLVKTDFVGWALKFTVCMLLKGTVRLA